MIEEKKALELIALGEGQNVEFKREVPTKVRELSEEVCALANSTGGYIFLGVRNDGTFTEGFAIDNSKRSALRDSVDQIEPQVDCDIYPLTVSGHGIWVMEVREGEDKPYFCSGAVHVRRGANSQKLRKPADVRKIFDDAGKLNFDMGLCGWFHWDDVSESAVRDFKQQAGLNSDATAKELITNVLLCKRLHKPSATATTSTTVRRSWSSSTTTAWKSPTPAVCCPTSQRTSATAAAPGIR